MITFNIYNTINELPKSWDALPHNDLFLKTPFLKALECSCPKNITPFYVAVFKKEKLVGIAIIQRVQIYLETIFRNTKNSYITRQTKQIVSKIVKGNALVVGNLMHTGQHGLFFISEELEYNNYLETIEKAIKTIKVQIKQQFNKKIRIIAFKDYFENDKIHNNNTFFKANNLYKVQVQPNMIFNVSDYWETPEDYIAAFTKKYRDRYKSARKKSKFIIKKELSFNEIKQHESQLFKLYKTVSDNARVNSFILCEDHFTHLKVSLNTSFKVFGYFLDNKLIGFYTLILNNKTLETYFLGYNHTLQHKHKLYLNMLYDMAFYAIENKFDKVIYARTAMEIKSSIGAKPSMMHIYMKHTNTFLANTILRFIVKYLNPTKQWQERHPFKAENK